MKKILVPLIMGAAMAAPNISAQTVINLDFRQNPLFEISTDNVTAALPGDGTSLKLGADLTIKGGSGTYRGLAGVAVLAVGSNDGFIHTRHPCQHILFRQRGTRHLPDADRDGRQDRHNPENQIKLTPCNRSKSI